MAPADYDTQSVKILNSNVSIYIKLKSIIQTSISNEIDVIQFVKDKFNYIDYPNFKIEENIKKDKLKDNKQTKELLLAKLNGINEQVQKLVCSR